MQIISRLVDKVGSVGALVSAMGCAACFPALASLGASVGLGFLSAYEGVFINKLLPIFAIIVLIANVLAFFSHKIWYRTLAGITGPIMVLLTLFPLWKYGWSTTLFYTGLALMLAVSIWDIVSSPINTCALPEAETSS